MIHHPLRDWQGYLPQSRTLQAAAKLPILLTKTRYIFGIVLGILAARAYIIFKRRLWHIDARSGHNPRLVAGEAGSTSAGSSRFLCFLVVAWPESQGYGEIAARVHQRFDREYFSWLWLHCHRYRLIAASSPLTVLGRILFAGLMVEVMRAMQRMAGLLRPGIRCAC